MSPFASLLSVLIALCLPGYFSYCHDTQARSLPQAWTHANRCEILHANRNTLLMPLGVWFGTSR